ncbi:MAG TPA: DUF937 domain-containing protein [Acidimicrobiia bacterium]|jgi:hypothetical protein|nr:hypothetical protein [Acidimicrobiia bacterium]HYJ25194.1 DUF937 domain-containing protein [Acidimicrobiia bacterium]
MDTADEILSQIPIDQLARQLGVDESTAEQAVRQAVPALLGGMQANAQDPGGAASLQAALGQHTADPFEGLDLGSIDTADGEAVVGNIFGDNSEQVINKLDGQTGGSGIMAKLLPILAPLVLSWLAGKFFGGQGQSADTGRTPTPASTGGSAGGGLGDLIGSATGAGGGSAGGLGDLLGGLLGGAGGSSAGASDVLGDLLGGLLGGGRKA